MQDKLGIYIHVPFCDRGKCPYCDFYSVIADNDLKKKYISAVMKDLKQSAEKASDRQIDTVYFGGGTPAMIGEGLAQILGVIRENYNVENNAEITFEANPAGITSDLLFKLRKAGFNRLSLGMQSAVPEELKLLGRRHTPDDVARTVNAARLAGFCNISLDLMLCVPHQTPQSMTKSIDFAASLEPEHISAYLLKVEQGTRYFQIKDTLNLPCDDEQADMYLEACEALEKLGYIQYEISNFAKPGFESRHNLKYWDCDEYLGFGPAAHSFFNGRRFYYPRSLEKYINGGQPVSDGRGGTLEEYLMLRLRLRDGLLESNLKKRYGVDFSIFEDEKLRKFESAGLVNLRDGQVSLTKKGFIVSNSVISGLIFNKSIDN